MINLNCPSTCPFVQRGEKNPVMPDGSPGGILFVGEAPGFNEVRVGHGFAGQAGQSLYYALEEIGYAHHRFDEDGQLVPTFARTNACLCHPVEKALTRKGKDSNRKPTQAEIDSCQVNLDAAIAHFKPKVIVAVGKTAYQAIGEPFDKFMDECFSICSHAKIIDKTSKKYNIPVIPIPHTSGLSWNRITNGIKHSDLGKKLLEIAMGLGGLSLNRTTNGIKHSDLGKKLLKTAVELSKC